MGKALIAYARETYFDKNLQLAPRAEGSVDVDNNACANIQLSSTPFAEGAFRHVFKGKYTRGERTGEFSVSKVFKSGSVFEGRFFEQDINAVDKAQEIINAFNSSNIISTKILLNHP